MIMASEQSRSCLLPAAGLIHGRHRIPWSWVATGWDTSKHMATFDGTVWTEERGAREVSSRESVSFMILP